MRGTVQSLRSKNVCPYDEECLSVVPNRIWRNIFVVGRLASGSTDRTIKIWEVSSGACTATLVGHVDAVEALVGLEGGRLASGAYDGTIKVWEVATGAPAPELWTGEGRDESERLRCLAVIDRRRLASGFSGGFGDEVAGGGTIKVFDAVVSDLPT